jgi:hypothetical protein
MVFPAFFFILPDTASEAKSIYDFFLELGISPGVEIRVISTPADFIIVTLYI